MTGYTTNVNTLTAFLQEHKFYQPSLLNNQISLQTAAERRSLALFQNCAQKVPAYQDFLKQNHLSPASVKTIADFQKIPPTTKENYIEKYNLSNRCWDGSLEKNHMISLSSGTTGRPHFWPRDLITEIEGATAHEFIFRDICQIKTLPTLLINGFAMGNWIAGTFTLACASLVAWKGYPLTIMTPGYSADSIIELLRLIANKYKVVIITGHTPFLKEIAELAKAKEVDFSKFRLIMLGTGQGITENWRDYVLELIKAKSIMSFINLYGSADAALMGFETDVSIYIRRLLSTDRDKNQTVFKDQRLPSLYNFDPRLTYFEDIDAELHITKNSGCPLIRYNIHDQGGVISNSDLLLALTQPQQSHLAQNFSKMKLPFVYLFGRDKFMVKIYGANIYSEHVQLAINHKQLQPHLTGRFIMEIEEDENHNPNLIIRVELSQRTHQTQDLTRLIKTIFIGEIRKVNSEYDFLLNKLKTKVEPKIITYQHGHAQYFPTNKVSKTA